jgi:hypothetical protein
VHPTEAAMKIFSHVSMCWRFARVRAAISREASDFALAPVVACRAPDQLRRALLRSSLVCEPNPRTANPRSLLSSPTGARESVIKGPTSLANV